MRRRLFSLWMLCFSLIVVLPACEFRQPDATPPSPTPSEVVPTSTGVAPPAITATPPMLPTAPPTLVPQPTPTANPDAAAWTILIYMAADNNLELAGLRDINEMEAAGNSDAVNVLVQIDRAQGETEADGDWRETRRYIIRGDADQGVIASDFAVAPGEVNMGEAGSLQDFITWGVVTHPANRYALILWDHGAGWQGFAFDEETNLSGEADHLTLPELETAVSNALAQTQVDKLDVVAFDACLMGQLDVFQTLQPFADYAVGSEALTPGQGWDYQSLLTELFTKPETDGSQLARQLVDVFSQYYTHTEPDDYVSMTAVDLTQLPPLTHALERLAAALLHDPALAASAVGDARSGTEQYARAYAEAGERTAAIDLGHFASILGQRSPDPTVQETAASVQAAIAATTLSHMKGSGFRHSQGIAAYFPRHQLYYAPDYGRVTQLTTWNRFLNSYYDVGLAALQPPELHLVRNLRETISVQNPAYLEFEVIGREIDRVNLIGGRYEEEGRRRLLEFDRLIPEPTHLSDGTQLYEWRDGLHEDFYVWDTRVTFLFDSFEEGGFVVMWPTAADSLLFTVPGLFRRAGAEVAQSAHLVFDHQSGRLVRVWGRQQGEPGSGNAASGAGAAEILPRPGDTFQVFDYYLDSEDGFVAESGGTLTFDDAAQLYFDWRPLPGGAYFLGFAAANTAGKQAQVTVDLTIDPAASADYNAYLDPYLGFQFLYPERWYAPVYSGTLLYTSDGDGANQMQVTVYPNLDRGVTAQVLQEEALFRFGAVDILFFEETAVGGVRGWRTAYGYDSPTGESRTGVFFTMVSNNTGYVVDLDGPQLTEAATIAAVNTMIDSWQFTEAGFGLQPGNWASFSGANFTIPKPSDFIFQQFNSWQRFSADRETFVAVRTQPASREVDDVLDALVRDASRDVTGFMAEESRQFVLGTTIWRRVDFSYGADGKEIWGYIMVRVEAGQEIVAWAEAPRSTYNQLEARVFLVMIADLVLK